MLKIVFLLVSYYKLLNTNAQDCIKIEILVSSSQIIESYIMIFMQSTD